jgi:hypothetical protein
MFRKLLCLTVLSINFLTLPVLGQGKSVEAHDPEIAASCMHQNSPCATSAAMLLNGVGDRSGKPLKLSYKASVSTTSKAWKEWFERIESEINCKLSDCEPVKSNDKLLVVEVVCQVDQYGHLHNLRVEGACPPEPFHSRLAPNCPLPAFEKLALREMQTLEGAPCLKFPLGERTTAEVTISGRFYQNYGPRFILKKEAEQSPAS